MVVRRGADHLVGRLFQPFRLLSEGRNIERSFLHTTRSVLHQTIPRCSTQSVIHNASVGFRNSGSSDWGQFFCHPCHWKLFQQNLLPIALAPKWVRAHYKCSTFCSLTLSFLDILPSPFLQSIYLIYHIFSWLSYFTSCLSASAFNDDSGIIELYGVLISNNSECNYCCCIYDILQTIPILFIVWFRRR